MMLPLDPTGQRRHTRRWGRLDDDAEVNMAFQVLDGNVVVAYFENSVLRQHDTIMIQIQCNAKAVVTPAAARYKSHRSMSRPVSQRAKSPHSCLGGANTTTYLPGPHPHYP